MKKTQELDTVQARETFKQETMKSLLREQLLHALGEPTDLLRVQIRPLWGVRYRANVFTGAGIDVARISYSFFLITDGDGNIVQSTPKLERRHDAHPAG